ncbi:unnamed protein product [Meganyctiphanes norvegica]|uniref:Uncharacterized protein n=1 Tax=Meganyctiphanes norvegica TaxID=48144 RepID=A0AAV2R3N7_MEGNR
MVSVDISTLLVVVLGLVGTSESIFFGGKGGGRQRRPHYRPKCVPYIHYETIYETEYVQQPVYETVYDTQYIPTNIYETVYKTVYSSVYSTEYVPQYVTKTDYNTQENYHTTILTSKAVDYQPVYVTQTEKVPTYITTTDVKYQTQTQLDYQTVYSTITEPQYITQTEYQTQYETQYETQYTPEYVTVTDQVVNTQTYCAPEPQGGYGLPVQVSYEGPQQLIVVPQVSYEGGRGGLNNLDSGYEGPQVNYGDGLSNLNSYSPPTSYLETSNFQVLGTPGILEFQDHFNFDGGQYLKKRQAVVDEVPKSDAKDKLQKRQAVVEESPISDTKEKKTEVNAKDKNETEDVSR